MSRINVRTLAAVETLSKNEMGATSGGLRIKLVCVKLPFLRRRCFPVPIPSLPRPRLPFPLPF